MTEYRAAIRLKPEYADAHYGLGDAVKEQGKLEAAATEYRTAIRLKPSFRRRPLPTRLGP